MAANFDEEKFLEHIVKSIGMEFKQDVLILEIMKGTYLISMEHYTVVLDKKKITELISTIGPYRLDKYILQSFVIQGMDFDNRRSQYIRYVFGIFED